MTNNGNTPPPQGPVQATGGADWKDYIVPIALVLGGILVFGLIMTMVILGFMQQGQTGGGGSSSSVSMAFILFMLVIVGAALYFNQPSDLTKTKDLIPYISIVVIVAAIAWIFYAITGFGTVFEAFVEANSRQAEATKTEIQRGVKIHRDFRLHIQAGGTSEPIENEQGRCIIAKPPEAGEPQFRTYALNAQKQWQELMPGDHIPNYQMVWDGRHLSVPTTVRVQVRNAGECKVW